jgi:hypothetical protein
MTLRRSRGWIGRLVAVRASAFVMTMTAMTPGVGHAADAQQALPPAFNGGVDLIIIDVQISPSSDAAMRDLTVSDFDIRIAGRKRSAVSATRLHYDEGKVVRNPPRADSGTESACVFGFFRTTDRPTAHYVVGVELIEPDRKEVRDVVVKVADKLFAAKHYMWRSPIRRSVSLPGGK